MNESIETKRPHKSARATAVKPKSARKPAKPIVRIRFQKVGTAEHTNKSNVIRKPFGTAFIIAKSIWEWFREKMTLIVSLTKHTMRQLVAAVI